MKKQKMMQGHLRALALLVVGAVAATLFAFSPTNGLTDVTSQMVATNTSTGLVGYWTFDEGTGSVSSDQSGNYNTAQINGATWTTGKFGYGLSFDGSNDSVATNLEIDQSSSTSGATFTAWVKPTGVPSSNNMLRSQIVSTDDVGYDWSLLMEDDDWTIFTGGDYEDDIQATLNTWTHVAATFDPNTELATLYVNGVNVDSAGLSYDASDYPIVIGDNPSGQFTEYFQGIIDEVRVYNRALSSSEIASVYGATTVTDSDNSGNNSSGGGLLGYWSFDGNANDGSGNGYNGTVTGATYVTGKSGQALAFDGDDDVVTTELEIDQSSSSNGATFAAWVRADTKPNAGNHMSRAQIVSSDDSNFDWSILMEDDDWAFFSGTAEKDGGAVDFGEWTHVAGVFDPVSELAYFYINGENIKSYALGYDSSDNPIAIGDNPSYLFDENFKGKIDEVYVYGEPLTSSEVKALYNGLADFSDDDGVDDYDWNYDDSGNTDDDSDDTDDDSDDTDDDSDDADDDSDDADDDVIDYDGEIPLACTDAWLDGTQYFSDIGSAHPYYVPASFVGYFDISDGYTDGTFRPYAEINRAETAKIILNGFGYEIVDDNGSNAGFWDLDVNAWYMPYLYTAQLNEIMSGNQDGSMKPGENVNRVELLKIFLKSATANLATCTYSPYPDVPTDAWYCSYAKFAKDNGLLVENSDGYFHPSQMMTRADVAYLFYSYNNTWCEALEDYLADYDGDTGNVGVAHYLTEDNSTSVASDQYHVSGGVDPWTIRSGEWTANTNETYMTLLDFDIPALYGVDSAILNLKLADYRSKTNEPDWCSFEKTFYVKKVTESWDADTADYYTINDRQESGETVATFTVGPNDEAGDIISIELPVGEIMDTYGITIDQADESNCRVEFYSYTEDDNKKPYFTVQ